VQTRLHRTSVTTEAGETELKVAAEMGAACEGRVMKKVITATAAMAPK
jgi:hypothetical protein